MVATAGIYARQSTGSRSSVVASLRGVTKNYGKVEAVREVDLEIRTGEVVALLGPNGAGKTTTVGLLLGTLRPTRGEVEVFGRSPIRAESRMRVGAMLQISGVPEGLKVREHIEIFRSYYPRPLTLKAILEASGLQELESRLYGKLSGGQRQRLQLALALSGDPDLLFLDEPTAGLDVGSRRAFLGQIRQIIGRERTVVLTTHNLEEADTLADRIVLIDHGRVIADGTPTEIKAKTGGRRIAAVTRLDREMIERLPGVTQVRLEGQATEIFATRAEPVVRELLRLDPDLAGLEVTGASLEEAFLALTGGGRS